MKAQDIQAEKLSLIFWISQLQDIALINRIKKIQTEDIGVPQWQRNIVRERVKHTKPDQYLPWEEVEKRFRFEE